MNTDLPSIANSIGRALVLVALLACANGAALAQPAPGGGPPGAGGGPGAGRPPPGPGGAPGFPGGVPEPDELGFGPRGGGFNFGPPPLPANAPQPAADPRNLDGTWYHENVPVIQNVVDMFGYKTPLNAAGQKVMARRLKSLKDGTPFLNASARCIPMGQPSQIDLNMPFQIHQSKDRFEFIFEEYHGYIQVNMDPSKAPPGNSYMGRSIGHWDGDTLIVETTGFKDGFWLDVFGTPASKDAKLTQRIRKVKTDHWLLEIQYTLDDPTYYTRPWSWVRDYNWRPDMVLFKEYNCEMQTGAKGGLDPSMVLEPQD